MKLNRKNITLKLDVSSVTSEGEHTLSCKVDFPDTVGDNVSISDWEDLHVTVTVEKQATKEIPVRGEFIGTEADNCLAGAVTTDPETLVLKGPAKELEGISYALATVGGKEVRDTIVEQSSVVFMGPDGTPRQPEECDRQCGAPPWGAPPSGGGSPPPWRSSRAAALPGRMWR